MPDRSDKEIIQGFIDPDTRIAAYNLLVDKYMERIYWHCRRIVINHEDADDAVQNTLIKVWRNLDGFRAESKLYTWLFRIATNESLSLIRKRRRQQSDHTSDQEYAMRMAENLETDPYFDGDDIQMKLQKAILNLPEKQRLVFNLKYYDNMKYEEMAEVLNTSVGALKASYHHAVRKIEKFFAID